MHAHLFAARVIECTQHIMRMARVSWRGVDEVNRLWCIHNTLRWCLARASLWGLSSDSKYRRVCAAVRKKSGVCLLLISIKILSTHRRTPSAAREFARALCCACGCSAQLSYSLPSSAHPQKTHTHTHKWCITPAPSAHDAFKARIDSSAVHFKNAVVCMINSSHIDESSVHKPPAVGCTMRNAHHK